MDLDLVIGTAAIQHRVPGRLGDQLRVTSHAASSTRSTVTVDFTVAREDGAVIAEAAITYIAVQADKSARLPVELAAPKDGRLTPPLLLSRLHEAQALVYAGGSAAPLEEVLHPEVSWHVPGTSPIAGDYVGRRAVIAYMARRSDLADRSFRMHSDELLVGPSHFAALTRGTAVIDGTANEWHTIGLYRSEDDLIIEGTLIPFDQASFDRIWSATS